jgi:hypothetical protein
MTNTTNNKISYEEYDLMWYDLKEGNITEAQWREFCDELFDQMIARKIIISEISRLKNR